MKVKDPVCGMTIEDTGAVATAVHEGKTYYFCSPHCKKKFDENPAAYAEAGKEERKAS